MTPDELLSRFMLALCVYREARGESALGKALVAQVILNRAADSKKRWPRTITGVITQRLQFSAFNKSDPNVTLYPKEGESVWAECVLAAERAMAANPPLTNANHYHTTAIKPAWSDSTKVVIVEGNHKFLYL